MKSSFPLVVVLFVAIFSLAFNKSKPVKVVFFGDSITQAGVGPIGYVTKIGEILAKQGLGAGYELVGAGIGGNKIYDLYLRLEDDVLSKKPDVVVVYVGINDVWHKSSHGTGTDPDKFIRFYGAIIKKLKSEGIRVILCTPSVIGERNDASNPQDGDLNYYSGLIRNLADSEGLELCDLRKTFLDFLQENNAGNNDRNVLTTDRVHLNEKGNDLVANSLTTILLRK